MHGKHFVSNEEGGAAAGQYFSDNAESLFGDGTLDEAQ